MLKYMSIAMVSLYCCVIHPIILLITQVVNLSMTGIAVHKVIHNSGS